jgi:hypothetical protein
MMMMAQKFMFEFTRQRSLDHGAEHQQSITSIVEHQPFSHSFHNHNPQISINPTTELL